MKTNRTNKSRIITITIAIAIVLLALIILTAYFVFSIGTSSPTSSSADSSVSETENSEPLVAEEPEATPEPSQMYSGEIATVNGSFTVKVPNGWTASISNGASFLAIMFARPNEINSLAYNPDTPPIIDPSGIASWNGLTEHFFVTSPSEARKFNPADHLEVSLEPFTFDDGHVGEKYFVVKHAAEAQQWGGLQKDAEWHGRTYIYDNGSKRIEAHLALYPSATIDIDFFEKVIRTIQPI